MELSTPYKNRPRRRWHGKNVWVNVAKESLEQQEEVGWLRNEPDEVNGL